MLRFILIYVYAYVYAFISVCAHVCKCPQKTEEGIRSPGAGLTECGAQPNRLVLDPLEEYQELLIPEPSPQPFKIEVVMS